MKPDASDNPYRPPTTRETASGGRFWRFIEDASKIGCLVVSGVILLALLLFVLFFCIAFWSFYHDGLDGIQ